ncbi:CGNR zinc finger domain-containing protein [Frondihabitans sp. PAMC 28766]|uniref:CGNR zinc finger domain-containing protein n=1 Tax=Frondihabitans sp. PAMC 28766 TaxID=1795630 RepID=UPI0009EC7757|nr:CGNR zinc finger domain-containing protein [Frondihabitans sp. PAMC 28766]
MSNGQPGGRVPAPGGLAFVQAFVNTADLEFGIDELDEEHAGAWVLAWGIPGACEVDRLRLMLFRDALRDWVFQGGVRIPDQVAAFIDSARLTVVVRDGAVVSAGKGALDAVIGRAVDAIRAAILDGSWRRLKLCERSICRWAYYDRSKNNAGHWCSTDICGAREKAHRAYARRADA